LGGAITDQVLSSVTNFVLGLVVARTLGPTRYGAFTLAYATYIIVLGVSRSMNTDALMVRYSASSHEDWRVATAAAAGGATSTGIVAGVLAIVIGAFFGGITGIALIAMGVMMPGLMLQDSWRMAFFAAGRPSRAVLNDLVWVVAMAGALAVLFATGHATLLSLTLAWGGAATLAAVVGFFQARTGWLRLNPTAWWRAHRDLGPRFLAEFGSTGALTQLTFYMIGFLAGLRALGSIRAATLVIGPFYVLLQGGTAFGVAESARILTRGRAALYRASCIFSLTLGAAACAWGVTAWRLPDSVGTKILGASWQAGRSVLVPVIVYMVASGLAIGANTGFRALAAARESLRTQLVVGSSILIGGVIGAATAGARGAAWGMAVANLFGTALRWWVYRRVVFNHKPASPSTLIVAETVPETA
jgi:O-antigen/teichoic acid export membrane protein